MIEARIECLCSSYQVSDMGLTLHKGEVIWVPADKAKASSDLKMASRIRAVNVVWQQRCATAKPQISVQRRKKQQIRPQLTTPVAKQVPIVPTVVAEDLVSAITDVVRSIIPAEINRAIQVYKASQPCVENVAQQPPPTESYAQMVETPAQATETPTQMGESPTQAPPSGRGRNKRIA